MVNPLNNSVKNVLWSLINIVVSFCLVYYFFTFSSNIIRFLPFVHKSALEYLKPNPMDYFWKLNIQNAPVDENQIRYYENYYRNLKSLYPQLKEADGILGYCAYQLGDLKTALKLLQQAIDNNPGYFWNYYNLAIVYATNKQYQNAVEILQRALALNPQESLRFIFTSEAVYLPLTAYAKEQAIPDLARHLQWGYKQVANMLMSLGNKEIKLTAYAF